MARHKDMTGLRFGRLTIIGREPRNSNDAHWSYQCDCGATGVSSGGSLRRGTSQSCGCLREEHRLPSVTIHGQTTGGKSTRTYNSWSGMIKRCTKEWHHKYHLYGALGVTVCERWLDFANFLADMGERPAGMTIDRFPDKYGNYEPNNCRWASVDQQNNNKKTNLIVTYRGAEMTIAEASRAAGSVIDVRNAWKRVTRGWPVEKALHTPLTR